MSLKISGPSKDLNFETLNSTKSNAKNCLESYINDEDYNSSDEVIYDENHFRLKIHSEDKMGKLLN